MTAIGLWAIAASNPDLPAVISPDGSVVSYAELAREADRYGRGFQALPRTIDYVPELPRDPNGKLYKRRLRDPYWAGRDRAI